jgi:hypothetical protein
VYRWALPMSRYDDEPERIDNMSIDEPRPTKRTKREIAVTEDAPMTVRQVFYRLVINGVIGKTETEYKSTVVRLLGRMRRDGEVPFG